MSPNAGHDDYRPAWLATTVLAGLGTGGGIAVSAVFEGWPWGARLAAGPLIALFLILLGFRILRVRRTSYLLLVIPAILLAATLAPLGVFARQNAQPAGPPALAPAAAPAPTPTPPVVPPTPPPVVPPTPAAASRPTIIADLESSMFNPKGKPDPAPDEYVCIVNKTASTIELDNWVVENDSRMRLSFPEFPLSPRSGVSLHTGDGNSTLSDYYAGEPSAIWDNAGDTVTILKPTPPSASEEFERVFRLSYTEPRKENDARNLLCGGSFFQPQPPRREGFQYVDFGRAKAPPFTFGDVKAVITASTPALCDFAFSCLQVEYPALPLTGEPGVGFGVQFLDDQNFAGLAALCIQARGQEGGERFDVVVQDGLGGVQGLPVARLKNAWTIVELPVDRFGDLDLTAIRRIDVVLKEPRSGGTVFFQKIFSTPRGVCDDVGPLIQGGQLLGLEGGQLPGLEGGQLPGLEGGQLPGLGR